MRFLLKFFLAKGGWDRNFWKQHKRKRKSTNFYFSRFSRHPAFTLAMCKCLSLRCRHVSCTGFRQLKLLSRILFFGVIDWYWTLNISGYEIQRAMRLFGEIGLQAFKNQRWAKVNWHVSAITVSLLINFTTDLKFQRYATVPTNSETNSWNLMF